MNESVRSAVGEVIMQALVSKGLLGVAMEVEPQRIKEKSFYRTDEACLYLNKSRWILKRLVDLRLLRPIIFRAAKRRHYFIHEDLNRAIRIYTLLKKHKLLNKLPLCTCVESLIEEQAQNALKCA
jgi:hypothetical protein